MVLCDCTLFIEGRFSTLISWYAVKVTQKIRLNAFGLHRERNFETLEIHTDKGESACLHGRKKEGSTYRARPLCDMRRQKWRVELWLKYSDWYWMRVDHYENQQCRWPVAKQNKQQPTHSKIRRPLQREREDHARVNSENRNTWTKRTNITKKRVKRGSRRMMVRITIQAKRRTATTERELVIWSEWRLRKSESGSTNTTTNTNVKNHLSTTTSLMLQSQSHYIVNEIQLILETKNCIAKAKPSENRNHQISQYDQIRSTSATWNFISHSNIHKVKTLIRWQHTLHSLRQ